MILSIMIEFIIVIEHGNRLLFYFLWLFSHHQSYIFFLVRCYSFRGVQRYRVCHQLNIDGTPCIIEEGESKAISFTLDGIPKWRECFTVASEATETNKKNTKNNQDMNFTEK